MNSSIQCPSIFFRYFSIRCCALAWKHDNNDDDQRSWRKFVVHLQSAADCTIENPLTTPDTEAYYDCVCVCLALWHTKFINLIKIKSRNVFVLLAVAFIVFATNLLVECECQNYSKCFSAVHLFVYIPLASFSCRCWQSTKVQLFVVLVSVCFSPSPNQHFRHAIWR